MHAEHRVPVIERHLEQHVVPDHTRVVDQDRNRAELLGDLVDGGLHLVGITDVRADSQRLAAGRRNRIDGRAAVAFLQVEHANGEPVRGQALGGGCADTASRAGDNRYSLGRL